ncbi:MAG: aryl-sulfate sulfotransferase [Bacteroidota bacterium]
MRLRFLCALLIAGLAACDTADFEPAPAPLEPDANAVPITDLLASGTDLADGLELNPSGIAPLAAALTFETQVPTKVAVEVLGRHPVSQGFDTVADLHAVPLIGLYPGADNRVVVRVTEPATERYGLDTLTVATPALPAFFPTVEILTASPAMEPGWTLSNLSIGNAGEFDSYPLLFDEAGAIRWYLDFSRNSDITFLIRRLANDNWLTAHQSTITEYDLLGTVINRWRTDGYIAHHEIVEMPNGNFLVAVNVAGRSTVEDHVIEVSRSSGAVVREWDLRPLLDVDRFDLVVNERDWFHMNAIFYDEQDDTLLLSGRNQGLVKVDGANNLVWIMAPHQGWGPAGINGDGLDTAEYLLTAVDAQGVPLPEAVQQGTAGTADFDWTWGQHAPMRLRNGNLFVFDNGFNRHFGAADPSPPWSRGVEYVIDEAAMTVQQVWEYGRDRGAAYFSPIISDVDELPMTGHRLIMPGVVVTESGSYAHVTEVTYPGSSVVFDARLHFTNLNNTGDGWGQLDIVYRSERLPLYPAQTTTAR